MIDTPTTRLSTPSAVPSPASVERMESGAARFNAAASPKAPASHPNPHSALAERKRKNTAATKACTRPEVMANAVGRP